MKKCGHCIEAAFEPYRAGIADRGTEATRTGDRLSLSQRHHVRAALDAKDVEPQRGQQPAVPAGARTELKDGPDGRNRVAQPAPDIVGLAGIVLVAIKQVVITRVIGERQC